MRAKIVNIYYISSLLPYRYHYFYNLFSRYFPITWNMLSLHVNLLLQTIISDENRY